MKRIIMTAIVVMAILIPLSIEAAGIMVTDMKKYDGEKARLTFINGRAYSQYFYENTGGTYQFIPHSWLKAAGLTVEMKVVNGVKKLFITNPYMSNALHEVTGLPITPLSSTKVTKVGDMKKYDGGKEHLTYINGKGYSQYFYENTHGTYQFIPSSWLKAAGLQVKVTKEGNVKTYQITNPYMPKQSVQSFVANLNVSKQTTQLITVVGNGGTSAKVSLHQKDGLWKEVLSVDGIVGKNGISSNKKEGDGRTPAGVYGLGTAFGIASNPGTKIPYRLITQNDYWVDDSYSHYYNMWVNTNEVKKDWRSAEHLASYPVQYKYGVVVNYNTERIPFKGSAIFLHVEKGSYTAGCIAVPQSTMPQLLKALQSNTKIVIAPSMSAISHY